MESAAKQRTWLMSNPGDICTSLKLVAYGDPDCGGRTESSTETQRVDG